MYWLEDDMSSDCAGLGTLQTFSFSPPRLRPRTPHTYTGWVEKGLENCKVLVMPRSEKHLGVMQKALDESNAI